MEVKKYAYIDYEANVHFFSELEEVLDAAMRCLEGRVPAGYKPEFTVSHKKKKIKNYITIYNAFENYFLGYELYDLLYIYMTKSKI